jgi:hypothetical protein
MSKEPQTIKGKIRKEFTGDGRKDPFKSLLGVSGKPKKPKF